MRTVAIEDGRGRPALVGGTENGDRLAIGVDDRTFGVGLGKQLDDVAVVRRVDRRIDGCVIATTRTHGDRGSRGVFASKDRDCNDGKKDEKIVRHEEFVQSKEIVFGPPVPTLILPLKHTNTQSTKTTTDSRNTEYFFARNPSSPTAATMTAGPAGTFGIRLGVDCRDRLGSHDGGDPAAFGNGGEGPGSKTGGSDP